VVDRFGRRWWCGRRNHPCFRGFDAQVAEADQVVDAGGTFLATRRDIACFDASKQDTEREIKPLRHFLDGKIWLSTRRGRSGCGHGCLRPGHLYKE
jgi:hypothetical protein